jgi:hypothetical protein
MIIFGVIGLAVFAMLVLLETDGAADCAFLMVGWRKLFAALVGSVLVQALLLPMLPGFLFALAVNYLRGSHDMLVLQINLLGCNTLIYGHIIYHQLGRAHRRRLNARAAYNFLP